MDKPYQTPEWQNYFAAAAQVAAWWRVLEHMLNADDLPDEERAMMVQVARADYGRLTEAEAAALPLSKRHKDDLLEKCRFYTAETQKLVDIAIAGEEIQSLVAETLSRLRQELILILEEGRDILHPIETLRISNETQALATALEDWKDQFANFGTGLVCYDTGRFQRHRLPVRDVEFWRAACDLPTDMLDASTVTTEGLKSLIDGVDHTAYHLETVYLIVDDSTQNMREDHDRAYQAYAREVTSTLTPFAMRQKLAELPAMAEWDWTHAEIVAAALRSQKVTFPEVAEILNTDNATLAAICVARPTERLPGCHP